ncbi:hypothetical protein DV26_01430 [Amycolatopsis mediterranei]|nr:SPW repeat protein [Amycolatopsis mediterranei]KDO12608.1 hypothetical protein DV26_01430 [Amycolatopsis mediterranei]KDU88692.1 hypothetical protein DV36_29225 [Amycolatopsis mediterranei]UZF72468.1 SPW repeat protein [Amycolatopsis mediterranei]
MTTSTPIQGHPDLLAMRAGYEQAAETPQARLVDGLVLISGLYIAMSPWVVGFSHYGDMAVVTLISGLALVLLGAGFSAAYSRSSGDGSSGLLISGMTVTMGPSAGELLLDLFEAASLGFGEMNPVIGASCDSAYPVARATIVAPGNCCPFMSWPTGVVPEGGLPVSRPRTEVGRQPAASWLCTFTNWMSAAAVCPGASFTGAPSVPWRYAASPTWCRRW